MQNLPDDFFTTKYPNYVSVWKEWNGIEQNQGAQVLEENITILTCYSYKSEESLFYNKDTCGRYVLIKSKDNEFDDFGGQIVDIIGTPEYSPPNLNTQGLKTQPEWLFSFFKNPIVIRPNLLKFSKTS